MEMTWKLVNSLFCDKINWFQEAIKRQIITGNSNNESTNIYVKI